MKNHQKFQKYLSLAYALYSEDSNLRCQHFSIIAYKNRIISIGRNSIKTHPKNLKNPKFSLEGLNISNIKGTCAEYSSIRKLKNLSNIATSKCKLFNIRIDNNKKPRNSKPCGSCVNLIKYFEFKEVWFTNNEGKWSEYKEKFLE
jgi:hypothetical protein